jgi:sulfur carrier protein
MEITLNNKTHSILENTVLFDLVLSQLGDKQKGVAVAVNDSVVPKSEWQNFIVNKNDNILIIKATQGG